MIINQDLLTRVQHCYDSCDPQRFAFRIVGKMLTNEDEELVAGQLKEIQKLVYYQLATCEEGTTAEVILDELCSRHEVQLLTHQILAILAMPFGTRTVVIQYYDCVGGSFCWDELEETLPPDTRRLNEESLFWTDIKSRKKRRRGNLRLVHSA
ncbi:MAG TPA: hypothetical protein VNA68_03175 [Candidatus Dormibacteraeota bacterium]|nr:hypothetical protein [Candidatus Dormibacteraeota bacterium]